MTDEELKKYGIHMATRLHTDDSKGQANWADIDDDDEDWAPETITWTDGTKVTIPHVEEHVTPPAPIPAPVPEVSAPLVAKENKILEKPRSPAPPTGSPSIKTGVLASGKGLILKGAPEKPTLVAKPPAPPTPVKSPWAALPPVDKASPVVMDIATHQMSRYPPPSHSHVPKGSTPPPQAKEIAADDFSRSGWREGPTHANRELFNSQSGRYEPVTDRRGSTRGDAHSRQPALLQRSTQADNAGPAEPSPAFQTTHSSGQYGHGRRRGSSNVSGGSGSYLQRLGKPHDQSLPPPELLNARRGSIGGSETSASPRNFSPSGLQGGPRQQQWQTRVSPAITNATLHYSPGSTEAHLATGEQGAPGAPSGVPGEDDYEYQKKLMRERREMAMKRRLEAEAKEEAERKERIRLKLEALGPPPESKSAKKDVTKETASTPQIQSREVVSDSQTPAQPEPKSTRLAGNPQPDADVRSNNLPNGTRPLSQVPTQPAPGKSDQTASDNKHGTTWQPRLSSQPDRLGSGWGPGNQASSRNVWGSPNNDRSLGNGTFVSDLGRAPDAASSQLPQMAAPISAPGPIGPPGAGKLGNKPETSSSRLAPIGPPQSSSRYSTSTRAVSTDQGLRASAWATAVQENDNILATERRQQMAEQERELQARGASYADVQGKITDNWRPTNVDEKGQRIEKTASSRAIRSQATAPSWSVGQKDVPQHDAIQRPPTAGAQAPSSNSTPQPRGSRFFPSRDVRLEESAPPETGRSESPSPPPPDMVGHPAFDGDATHPHVALPPTRPVVRLPPTPAAATASPRSHPSLNWATPAPFRDTSASHAHPHRPAPISHGITSGGSTLRPMGENWQERIHDLLAGRKPSPTKPPMPVDSSSRNVLHSSVSHSSATVSLPASTGRAAGADDSSLTTKVMDEDCFEEQEMGSLPPVRIPNTVSELAWHPALTPKPTPRKFMLTASTSAESVFFIPDQSLRIYLPGMSDDKKVLGPSTRSRSNPRRGRGGSRYASGQRGGKREASSTFSPDFTSSPGNGSPSGSRGGGRGGYRGSRSDNWSRQPSATVQT